ncbi:MAG: RsmD family RNA methyltransferase [Bifidobacteriaceae bacterium]|jgi:16S rRNA (guanine966-N2)-methyltransferase|nr:RsmD family RNA methyltransferase [Bifidobacteriaceae bacterium]
MQIISGKYKGLSLPKAYSITRPTTAKVKQAIFSKLENMIDFDQFSFYDLFAGTGSLGFEALSRGAREVYLNDNSKKVVDLLDRFCKDKGFENVKLTKMNANRVKISDNSQCEAIAFVDPPYRFSSGDVAKLSNLKNAKLIIYEHSKNEIIDFQIGVFKCFKLESESVYGDTIISFISKKVLD